MNHGRVKIPCEYEYILNFLSESGHLFFHPKPHLVDSSTGILLTWSQHKYSTRIYRALLLTGASPRYFKAHSSCSMWAIIGKHPNLLTLSRPLHNILDTRHTSSSHLFLAILQKNRSFIDLGYTKIILGTRLTSSCCLISRHYSEVQLAHTISAAPLDVRQTSISYALLFTIIRKQSLLIRSQPLRSSA